MQGAEAGALDDVIGDVIPTVEAELFGLVSEEKEANAFVGGCKEAKRLRAYATYQLLARGITFRDHMTTLLQPVSPHPDSMHRVCLPPVFLPRLPGGGCSTGSRDVLACHLVPSRALNAGKCCGSGCRALTLTAGLPATRSSCKDSV